LALLAAPYAKGQKMFGIVTSTALEISIGIYEESLNIVVSY
jgi:hypothetical protein